MAEEMINGSWRLVGKGKFKNVWINKDLDEEEKHKIRELVAEAKRKKKKKTAGQRRRN